MPITVMQQENSCKIIELRKQKPFESVSFEQMKATAQTEFLSEEVDKAQNTGKGMDSFPLPVYNQMIEYSLRNGKIRNAMFFILMANYGMRCSDVRRLRFAHLFDSDGKIREHFALPNGEKKTGKQVIYYNNEATVRIISLYLSMPRNRNKNANDFLFVSESGNSNKSSLKDVEIDDIYNRQIEDTEDEIKSLKDQKKKLLRLCTSVEISDDDFAEEYKNYNEQIKDLEKHLDNLYCGKSNYISKTPNAENIYIQKPITKQAAEDIVKNTLSKIGIYAVNRKDKEQTPNYSGKLNTHSLRKVFAEQFEINGQELKAKGKLHYDSDIHNLLQGKLMHSSHKVTDLYSKTEENAWKTICQHMNIGLEVLENFKEDFYV